MLEALARVIQDSPLSALATGVLGNVPGAPPLIQTAHLLGISAVMGSAVLVDLRILGLGLSRQAPTDLGRRVLPALWWALPVLALSGLIFVLARPVRYLANPVFVIKMLLVAVALVISLLIHRSLVPRGTPHSDAPGPSLDGKTDDIRASRPLAALSLLCWLAVVLSGRWIAYADYLFGEWRLFGQ